MRKDGKFRRLSLGLDISFVGVQGMSDLVEFRHLKYIAAVAETANFTRAAERLFIAQPSLSKQIRDLEDGIGVRIFRRDRGGVSITPAGQMIASYADEAIRNRNQIIRAARAIDRGEIPALRIGFSCFVNPGLMECLGTAYGRLFPGCAMQLAGGDPRQILGRMERRELDGALL